MQADQFDLMPLVLGLAYGGWMATTGPETKLRLAVMGDSREEACSRFAATLKRWREFSDLDKEQSPLRRAQGS